MKLNLKKLSREELREQWKVVQKSCETSPLMLPLKMNIEDELDRRNSKLLYDVCRKVLRNNSAEDCKRFVNGVLCGTHYHPFNDHYEIDGYYTKNRCPVVVEFK